MSIKKAHRTGRPGWASTTRENECSQPGRPAWLTLRWVALIPAPHNRADCGQDDTWCGYGCTDNPDDRVVAEPVVLVGD